ncbi:hypothetical protein IAU60_000467 [Kwoniella sp. DSM 27419]
MSRPRDIDEFLSSYPGQSSSPSADKNLKFYSNELACQPDGLTYEQFVHKHGRDYIELEMNQWVWPGTAPLTACKGTDNCATPSGYVQWFFPIRERGVNPQAQPLQAHEIEAMKADPAILSRLLRSYKMMLAFYGIDFDSGHLKLSSDHQERLRNLKDHSHNLLRLTRILKHLSEFPPLRPHAAPLVLFFTAAHSEGLISFAEGSMRGDSLDRWWSNCFRDAEERKQVRKIVAQRGGFGEGSWGWNRYNEWVTARGVQGYLGES